MRKSVHIKQTGQVLQRVRKDLSNESLYTRLCSHFSVHFTAHSEYKIPLAGRNAALFCAGWRNTWTIAIGVLLGCQAREVEQMRATDMRAPVAPVQYLRFCRACMLAGYHSALFQVLAVVRCPVHNEPLCETCPHCDQLIVLTLRHTRDYPFLCPHCDQPLSTFNSQRQCIEEALHVDRTLGGMRLVLSQAAECSRSVWYLDQWWRQGVPAVRHRQVLRALALPDHSDFAFPWRFKIQPLKVDARACHKYALVGVYESCFRWLSVNCPGASTAAKLSANKDWTHFNRPMSLLGVALFRTLRAFQLAREFHSVFVHGSMWEKERSRMTTRSFGGDYPYSIFDPRTAHLELFNHLAIQIVRSPKRIAMRDVSKSTFIEEIEYTPIVTIREVSKSELDVRSRVDEGTLKRLFQRYENAQYVEVPDSDLERRVGRTPPT